MQSSDVRGEIVVEVARLATAALATAVARLLPQIDPRAPVLSPAALQAMLDAPGSALLLARASDQAGSIVGMLMLSIVATPTGVRAWIDDVVVDIDARSQGVGARLVQEALRLAEARGAATVSLTSRPERTDANRLYQRLGFERRETNVYRYVIARQRTTA